SPRARELLERLRSLTRRFEQGLIDAGFEVIPGEHPVVPLLVRDTMKTRALVAHLFENGVLATGLAYPVVPRGDEEIRFQINADHTEGEMDYVLEVLRRFGGYGSGGRRAAPPHRGLGLRVRCPPPVPPPRGS